MSMSGWLNGCCIRKQLKKIDNYWKLYYSTSQDKEKHSKIREIPPCFMFYPSIILFNSTRIPTKEQKNTEEDEIQRYVKGRNSSRKGI